MVRLEALGQLKNQMTMENYKDFIRDNRHLSRNVNPKYSCYKSNPIIMICCLLATSPEYGNKSIVLFRKADDGQSPKTQ
jgi:hypothetical protein